MSRPRSQAASNRSTLSRQAETLEVPQPQSSSGNGPLPAWIRSRLPGISGMDHGSRVFRGGRPGFRRFAITGGRK